METRTAARKHDGADLQRVEVGEIKESPGIWVVDAFCSNGDVHQSFFSGPGAKARAEEYAIWKYRGEHRTGRPNRKAGRDGILAA